MTIRKGIGKGIRSRSERVCDTVVRSRSERVSDRDRHEPNRTEPNQTTCQPRDDWAIGGGAWT